MVEEITYEEVADLEKNIELKDKAKKIMNDFVDNVKLDIKGYKGEGRFEYWSDAHNSIYIDLKDDNFYFRCRFLHESYDVEITFNGIFQALKNNNRGVEHLETHIRSKD